ncbi:MAG TPA: hypothetical protein VME92_02315 [Acetobacteraceae bacterium]|nr:hypothetical protein [Acetobacteraceae bacterium]
MDAIVYSALEQAHAAARPDSLLLRQALDCAAGQEWRRAHDLLQIALRQPTDRRRAHFLLWEVCQALGHPAVAMANLHAVLRDGPLSSRPSAAPRRRVLALAVPGDFQANLPLGTLLDPAGTELHTLWISDPDWILGNPCDPPAVFLGDPPPFDCVFVTIAEDARHAAALRAADRLVAALGRPAINCGARIAALSRAGAAALLEDLPGAVVPAQHLVTRDALESGTAPGLAGRFIIRPDASHAGRDLTRIDDPAALEQYLARVPGERFCIAPFIDFRSPDGFWRKYRVIFVDGRPLPFHLAIHDDWAIWYYNAQMDRDAWKREEEARFVADLAAAFPEPALAALQAIARRVRLDYFGVDCGVMPDGRLVVFEIETGMLVHDWDPPDLYPYRRGAVQAIRRATEAMIDACIAASRGADYIPLG